MSSADTAPKERTKIKRLNSQTKEFVRNIYNLQVIENSGVHEVERRVAAKTGMSSKSIFNTVTKYKQNHKFSEPRRKFRCKLICDNVKAFDKNAIRRKVYQFFFRN